MGVEEVSQIRHLGWYVQKKGEREDGKFEELKQVQLAKHRVGRGGGGGEKWCRRGRQLPGHART